MKKIIVINGPGGAGKDTFIKICRLILLPEIKVYSYTSIFPIKQELVRSGIWDGKSEKTEEVRIKMVNLKKKMSENEDIPNNYLIKKINELDSGLIFVHIREAKEIVKFINLSKLNKINPLTLHYSRVSPEMKELNSGVDLISQTKEFGNYDFDIENKEIGLEKMVEIIKNEFLSKIFKSKDFNKINLADLDNIDLHIQFDDQLSAGII